MLGGRSLGQMPLASQELTEVGQKHGQEKDEAPVVCKCGAPGPMLVTKAKGRGTGTASRPGQVVSELPGGGLHSELGPLEAEP